MRITEALATLRPFFSFEFFPPKDDVGSQQLFGAIEKLKPLHPAFVSITYGAGGSTRTRTLALAKQIQSEIGLTVLAHVTCVGSTRAELRALFDDLARSGIKNVLALRGDPPKGSARFEAVSGGFAHASDLIAMLRRNYDFCIGAAFYPERHVEAASDEDDLRHLVEKVDAGAEFLISQLFLNNDRYTAFERRARAAGIAIPMLPGLMPITNYQQVARFAAGIGTSIPPKLLRELELRKDDARAVEDLGVAYATLQATELFERGVQGIHFYTLNRSPATRAIVSAMIAGGAWRPFF
ncbi:MAG: methylenetetrahydrofolate reductase [NAD(P)H] [Candidatus Eremiobacteraeota bacterium]|nr:methylenetetrahydrofolate reductase [NAD(P)H] [Candidatus Eremiobacteraeota bacterium]